MEDKIEKERFEYIELLKAISIFIVLFCHYDNLNLDVLNAQNNVAYFNSFLYSICVACVPIFFFVNGALILNKAFDLNKHIHKLIKIIILTPIWAIITLLILMIIKHETMSLLEFAKSLWTLKSHWIDHLWFLQALAVIYVFFPLIKTAYDHERKQFYFFLALASIMTFGNVFLSNCANIFEFMIGKNYLTGDFNFFHNFNAFKGIYGYSIVYFMLGGLFFQHRARFNETKWVKRSIIAILISMVLITIYGVMMTNSNGTLFDIIWYGNDTIPALCIVISIFILSLRYKGTSKAAKLIRLIGKNSLGILLVHRIWGTLLIDHFIKFSFSRNIITNLLFGFVVTLLSLGSVLLLKKVPVVKKLFFM